MQEEEIFDSSFVPDEVWYHVLRFLDPKALMKVQSTCKTFYDLGRSDSIWKAICLHYFGDLAVTTLEKHDNVINQPKGVWKRIFKKLAEYSLSEEYIAFISRYYDDFSATVPKEEAKLSAPSTLEISFPPDGVFCWDKHRLCRIYVGEGWAPWGAFATFALSHGLHVAFCHLYSEGWNTALERVNDDGSLQGAWKSNWQSICGVGLVLPNPSTMEFEDTLKEKLDEEYETIDLREQTASQLQGRWSITMVLEDGNTHKMSLVCHEDHCGSLKGQITQDSQTAFDPGANCAVLGITDGEMVAWLLNFSLKSRRSSSRDYIVFLGRIQRTSKTNTKEIQNNNNNNSDTSSSSSTGWEINGIGAVYSTQMSCSVSMQKEANAPQSGKATLKRPISISS